MREEQRRQRGCIAGRMPAGLSPRAAKAAARTIKKLQKVPVSAFRPVQGRIDTFGTMSWDRPKTAKKPKAPFHFDCDFDKHDLSRVGNIFGVPTWKIADRCVSWIRKQDLMVDGSRPASAHTASALSGSERYNPADDDSSDRLTHTYSLLLVDRQLRVRPIVPTSADVATVASLDTYSIHDFQKRFTALSKSRGE